MRFLSVATIHTASKNSCMWQRSSWWETSCFLHRSLVHLRLLGPTCMYGQDCESSRCRPFHDSCLDILSHKHQWFLVVIAGRWSARCCTPPSSSLLPQPFFRIFNIVQFSGLQSYLEKIFHTPWGKKATSFWLWMDDAEMHTWDLDPSQTRLARLELRLKGKLRRLDLVTHADWKMLCRM